MPDNDNENLTQEQHDSPRNHKPKSFMEVYREVNEREKAEELKRESELEAARAERERKARDRYAEKLRQEKLELLKLKQGLISEEDMPAAAVEKRHYTVWEKIGNFFYHNKTYIIIVSVVVLLLGYLLYDLLSRVQPDVAVMFIADDYNISYKTDVMSEVLKPYCKDYNGDGKISVRVSYVPALAELSDGNAYALQEQQANQTKLFAEFQAADTIIIIADKKTCETMEIDKGVFADLSEIFPNDENADGYRYMLKGTAFAEDIGYPELSEELFVAFREPREGMGVNTEKFKKNFSSAAELWSNYINGNIVSPADEE